MHSLIENIHRSPHSVSAEELSGEIGHHGHLRFREQIGCGAVIMSCGQVRPENVSRMGTLRQGKVEAPAWDTFRGKRRQYYPCLGRWLVQWSLRRNCYSQDLPWKLALWCGSNWIWDGMLLGNYSAHFTLLIWTPRCQQIVSQLNFFAPKKDFNHIIFNHLANIRFAVVIHLCSLNNNKLM